MQKVGEPIEVYVSEMAYGLVLVRSSLEMWTFLGVKYTFCVSGEMLHCFQIVFYTLLMGVIVKKLFAGWLIV